MADSTKAPASKKLGLNWRQSMGLHPDFPLFPHQSGRWAKKVRGSLHYFGKVADDPKGERAIGEWVKSKDTIIATGRKPREAEGQGLTIGDLCNRFLTTKTRERDAGRIKNLTFLDYHRVAKVVVEQFGKRRHVDDLRPADFEKLWAHLAKTHNSISLGNRVQRIRTIFNYAFNEGLIDREMRYGTTFRRPSRKEQRIAKAKQGSKTFEAAEIRQLLAKAGWQLKAMILLGVNIGFGNSDCAQLPLSAVDLENGQITFPRPKTGIDRRCPLWKETTDALRKVIAKRRAPVDPAHAPLVFVTKRGGTFAKDTSDNPISKEFGKLLREVGLQRDGRAFYGLRHSFRTQADDSRDQVACDVIMGHQSESMAENYRDREKISDDRLRAVVDHVHRWLFAKPSKPKKRKAAQAS